MRIFKKNLNAGVRIEVKVMTPTDDHGICTPCFSVTYTEYERNRDIAGGCNPENPELVVAHFPELAGVVALHLSDAQGVPMHCEANGWHWLAKAAGIAQAYAPQQSVAVCYDILARHLRLSHREATDIVQSTKTIARQDSPAIARENFVIWIEDLKPRWLAEAQAAQTTYG
jgi:hypothetical protein